MPARFSSTYSLWPEQARPRHRGSVALVSGGFVAGAVVAIAANWVLLDASRPTVGSEVVSAAPGPAIAAATLPPDEGSGAPQACHPKRAPYGIDRCPPVPVGTTARGEQDQAAPILARGRSRLAARATLPIIGSTPAMRERDETDGRSGGAPPAIVAEELTRVAPVGSGSGRVDMSAPAAPPETFSRLDGAPAPKLESSHTTATLEGAGNEAGRPTEPVSTVGATAARETASGEGSSEETKHTTKSSKNVTRKQSRTAAANVRRAERRTARRIPARDRIRKMSPSPFGYVAQQSYGYPQPRYGYAAQQSYGYPQPRYGYAAQQSYGYPQRHYGYAAPPHGPGLFPF